MADNPHFEKVNRRNTQIIDQFCQNFARWCISALRTPSANKILRF